MKIFRYEPVHVNVVDSYGIDRRLFVRLFQSHAEWLEANDIDYQVSGFRWPELLSMLVSRDVLIEFELSIEDDAQAVMFRLFSGFPISDAVGSS